MMFHSFLLVDVGNTRVKWDVAAFPDKDQSRAFYSQKATLLVKGEMPTADATPDRIRELKKAFAGHFLVIASVVPQLTLDFCRIFKRGFHSVSSESSALGLEFDYPRPAEIGADRLAAAVAAHEAGKWPVIIVSCGTATAFTVLDAKGRFCGGVIAPGLSAQHSSLLQTTAQLPKAPLRLPASALAKSTKDAISAGVLLNFQGGVKEIIRRLGDALPDGKNPDIVLTGGNAHYLSVSLDQRYTLQPLLVFEGLRIIGNRVYPYRPD